MNVNLLGIVAIIGFMAAAISFCVALYGLIAWYVSRHQGEEGIE